ncbi:unnamed protein product [Moneuplotes crassus]|uniref:C2H2-type domain-containing protein n=1 Tax=Euplotes crassus TaxID=5936 RepID=A0AAD1Y739_EUPCR|nr:unnamed protein product [Moneuplotes crassus]
MRSLHSDSSIASLIELLALDTKGENPCTSAASLSSVDNLPGLNTYASIFNILLQKQLVDQLSVTKRTELFETTLNWFNNCNLIDRCSLTSSKDLLNNPLAHEKQVVVEIDQPKLDIHNKLSKNASGSGLVLPSLQSLLESSKDSVVYAPKPRKPQVGLSTRNVLEILGYCTCDHSGSSLSPVEIQGEVIILDNENQNDASHNSNTQSICDKEECKDCDDLMEDTIKPLTLAPKQAKESPLNIREEDEYLMDLHPHTNEYVTNPKTSRQVKKIVCLHPGCGKKFDKKWNFKDHIRMHMGDRPYKCAHCPKTFTQKGNLDKHMKQHEFKDLKSRKIHECHICHKKFTEKYNLKNHLKKHETGGKDLKKQRRAKAKAKKTRKTR